MGVALAGVDLAAFAAIFLLIGLLLATVYVLERVKGAIDVRIPVVDVRPFHALAVALEDHVIAGVRHGIAELDHVATTLYHYSTAALEESLDGIKQFAAYARQSLRWLEAHRNDAIGAIAGGPVGLAVVELRRIAGSLRADLTNEIKARESTVATMGRSVIQQARLEMAGLKATIEGEALASFPQVRRDVEKIAADAVAGVGSIATGPATTLAGAAEQALEHARAIAEADAAQLRELLGKLNPADVAALIASIPLTTALVRALEAETGLENPECRQKVKGICGTDPARWAGLLGGLVALGVVLDLETMAKLAEEAVRFVEPAVDELVRVSVAAANL